MTQTLMTNTHLYLAIGLPTLAIMTSLAINLFMVSGVRENIKEVREDIREIRSDIKLLTGKVYELMGQKP
jgi:hypothetical protein